jgi:aminoglycoside phosphotransferase (APT) family kinase protein
MDDLIDVLPKHRFDEAALLRYLATAMPGIGSLHIRQFQGGQSNPTYLLETALGLLVLRKKPPGLLLPSAHQVEREFRILSALHGSTVPVPEPLVLCEDTEIIGTSFFVMRHVEGRIFQHPTLTAAPVEERRTLFHAAAETLAALHRIDFRAVGLEGFGRSENYLLRQIERWSNQYRASIQGAGDTRMEMLIRWLETNRPETSRITIAHGDYRIGNLLFAPDAPRVAAVLDWELSTIGDPLSDLAYCCLAWRMPHDIAGVKGLAGLDLVANGIPDEAEFITVYCQHAGLERIENWTFYLVFSLFRLAAILQGIHARAMQGNAAHANALEAGKNAGLLAQIAYDLLGETKNKVA